MLPFVSRRAQETEREKHIDRERHRETGRQRYVCCEKHSTLWGQRRLDTATGVSSEGLSKETLEPGE